MSIVVASAPEVMSQVEVGWFCDTNGYYGESILKQAFPSWQASQKFQVGYAVACLAVFAATVSPT